MDARVVRRNDRDSANQPIPQSLMIALFVEMPHVLRERTTHDRISKAPADAEFKGRLALDGGEPWVNPPAKFGKVIKTEIARWAPVVKASGARRE